MTESRSYTLKEIEIGTDASHKPITMQDITGLDFQFGEIDRGERRYLRTRQGLRVIPGKCLGGTVTISATEAEYDPGVMEMWLERMRKQMVDAMLKGIDARIAEGQDIGLVIVPEEWETRLTGLEAGLAERDIRLYFMPYMAKQDGFYLISRDALEGNL